MMTWRTFEMAGKWLCATAEWSKRGEAPASPQRRTRSGKEVEMREEEMFSLEVKRLMLCLAIVIDAGLPIYWQCDVSSLSLNETSFHKLNISSHGGCF